MSTATHHPLLGAIADRTSNFYARATDYADQYQMVTARGQRHASRSHAMPDGLMGSLMSPSDPAQSKHVPVILCSSRDHCTHVRSCVRNKICLNDGHPKRRPKPYTRRGTVAAYIATTNPPTTPMYTVQTSASDPGWITITKGAAIAPVPLPPNYAAAQIGDIGFFSQSVKAHDSVAISGIVNPLFANTNSFNKWWVVISVQYSSAVGGDGSVWTLAPIGFQGLHAGDFLQASYFAMDSTGPIGPIILRIVSINSAWCSWVLQSTNIATTIKFQSVHLRACVRICRSPSSCSQAGRCSLMCRLPQVASYVDAAHEPFEDRTYNMSHIKPYHAQADAPRPKPHKPTAHPARHAHHEKQPMLEAERIDSKPAPTPSLDPIDLIGEITKSRTGSMLGDLASGLMETATEKRAAEKKHDKKKRDKAHKDHKKHKTSHGHSKASSSSTSSSSKPSRRTQQDDAFGFGNVFDANPFGSLLDGALDGMLGGSNNLFAPARPSRK